MQKVRQVVVGKGVARILRFRRPGWSNPGGSCGGCSGHCPSTILSPMMEKQMEKNMEPEMETGGYRDLRNLFHNVRPCSLSVGTLAAAFSMSEWLEF